MEGKAGATGVSEKKSSVSASGSGRERNSSKIHSGEGVLGGEGKGEKRRGELTSACGVFFFHLQETAHKRILEEEVRKWSEENKTIHKVPSTTPSNP